MIFTCVHYKSFCMLSRACLGTHLTQPRRSDTMAEICSQCVCKTSPLKGPCGVNLFVRGTERRGQDNRSWGHRPVLVNRAGVALHALRANTIMCFFWAPIGSSVRTRAPPSSVTQLWRQERGLWDFCGCGLVFPSFPYSSSPIYAPRRRRNYSVWLDLPFQRVQLILPQRASILSGGEAASPAL